MLSQLQLFSKRIEVVTKCEPLKCHDFYSAVTDSLASADFSLADPFFRGIDVSHDLFISGYLLRKLGIRGRVLRWF